MALDDDDKKLIEEMINKVAHAALTERDKRDAPKRKKELEEFGDNLFKRLTEKKSEPKGDDDEEPKGDDEEPKGDEPKAKRESKSGMTDADRARLKRAEKLAAEAKAEAEKQKAEAQAERQKAQRQEERSRLVTSLTGKVKGPLLDMVVDKLHGRHITRDSESGDILWKDDKGDLLPLNDGLEAWTKTDEAKEVAPPRAAGGSGQRGPGQAGSANTEFTFADIGSRIGGR